MKSRLFTCIGIPVLLIFIVLAVLEGILLSKGILGLPLCLAICLVIGIVLILAITLGVGGGVAKPVEDELTKTLNKITEIEKESAAKAEKLSQGEAGIRVACDEMKNLCDYLGLDSVKYLGDVDLSGAKQSSYK